MPWPALALCVSQASPAINTRGNRLCSSAAGTSSNCRLCPCRRYCLRPDRPGLAVDRSTRYRHQTRSRALTTHPATRRPGDQQDKAEARLSLILSPKRPAPTTDGRARSRFNSGSEVLPAVHEHALPGPVGAETRGRSTVRNETIIDAETTGSSRVPLPVPLVAAASPTKGLTCGARHTQGGRGPGFESTRRDRPAAGEAHTVASGFGVDQCRVHLGNAAFDGPQQTIEPRMLPRQRQALWIVLVVVEPVRPLTSEIVQTDPSRCQFRNQFAPESDQ